jgi:hypothetical protein
MRWFALALLLTACSSSKPTTCDSCVLKGLYCNPVTFQCMDPTADLSVSSSGQPPDMTQVQTNDDMAQ